MDFAEGAEIHIQTVDATTDELLGEAELPMGLACANVGENDGFWVGSEIHVRYSGFELAELEGREAKLMADVEAMAGDWHTLAVWSVRLRMDEVP